METQLYHTPTYTFFDLDTGEIVEDGASSQWDIGFQSTTIIANSENGGGILSLNIAFEDTDEAPVEGYEASTASWYTYTNMTPPVHAILPIDEVTLIVKTPDGNYGKIKMLSYCKGNPDTSSEEFADADTRPEARYFTFQYALQSDGSVFLDN